MSFVGRVILKLKKKRIALLVSLCNAIVLTLMTYWLNNQPLFTGEDLNNHAWMEWIKKKVGLAHETKHNDVIYVNVGYDKQFVEVRDSFEMLIGKTDITDRMKLLTFLKILRKTGTYKYVFLDIRFEKGLEVPDADSTLFAEIKQMRDIVVADHSDIEIADSSLLQKSALADFKSTIVETNFVRYKYSYAGKCTMPLYAYKELTGKDIEGNGLYYTCDGKLCYNSLFIEFPVETFGEYDAAKDKQYYHLGSELLENYTAEDIGDLTKGKYVIIGDMIEDLHDTYSGKRPGSVIIYYAFNALLQGKHFVSYGLVLFLAILYFLISFSLFNRQSLLERIPFVRKSRSTLLHFVLSLIEYTFILSLVVLMLNMFMSITVSIFLPSVYFAIQKNIIHLKRTKV